MIGSAQAAAWTTPVSTSDFSAARPRLSGRRALTLAMSAMVWCDPSANSISINWLVSRSCEAELSAKFSVTVLRREPTPMTMGCRPELLVASIQLAWLPVRISAVWYLVFSSRAWKVSSGSRRIRALIALFLLAPVASMNRPIFSAAAMLSLNSAVEGELGPRSAVSHSPWVRMMGRTSKSPTIWARAWMRVSSSQAASLVTSRAIPMRSASAASSAISSMPLRLAVAVGLSSRPNRLAVVVSANFDFRRGKYCSR